MRRTLSAALGFWISLVPFAQAQTAEAGAVLVELYTSQGCSACPPADAFMAELAPREDIIALSLHVDYWDYIGWTDSFADPAFSDRQKDYARAVGANTVYTPQMVIAGRERIEGFRVMQITDLIQRHRNQPPRVGLRLNRNGDALDIEAEADPPLSHAVLVQLVRYTPSRTVRIENGENAGRTVTYHNIVTTWEMLGLWDGQGVLQLRTNAEGGDPLVVILQETGPGPVLAAARLR